MADEWKYGDVVRRAVTMNPPVYQYVMYIRPGQRTAYRFEDDIFTGLRLTDVGVIPELRSGTILYQMRRDLFELVPDE